MARLRRRISIARLMAAVLVVALAFALLRPHWPIALFVAIALLIPIFVAGLPRTEVAAVLLIIVLTVLMLIPAMQHSNCRESAAGPALKAIAPASTPAPIPAGFLPGAPRDGGPRYSAYRL